MRMILISIKVGTIFAGARSVPTWLGTLLAGRPIGKERANMVSIGIYTYDNYCHNVTSQCDDNCHLLDLININLLINKDINNWHGSCIYIGMTTQFKFFPPRARGNARVRRLLCVTLTTITLSLLTTTVSAASEMQTGRLQNRSSASTHLIPALTLTTD